jgi:hypothetical protein
MAEEIEMFKRQNLTLAESINALTIQISALENQVPSYLSHSVQRSGLLIACEAKLSFDKIISVLESCTS